MRSILNFLFPYFTHFEVTQTFVWRTAFKWSASIVSQREDGEIGNFYEFGVFNMRSTVNFHKTRNLSAIFNKKLKNIRIFCFDSFEGLPEPTKGDGSEYPVCVKGDYRGSLEHAESVAKKNRIKNIEFIKGFYEDTLTDDLKSNLSKFPPGFVHIDCDLYSSTITALRWLDGFALHGAIYFFDDIWSYLNHPDAGETKAIGEYNADLSTSGMLIEHPLSLGSKKVYTYVPRDPSKLRWRSNPDSAIRITAL